jgi:LmbE family N-acetylglucosaminyl deacetylase
MSGGGEHAAPAPAAKPAAAPPVDPIEELARKIYIELAAQIHSQLDGKPKPDHLKVAEISFRLAEAFQEGNLKFNTAARARADAKAKASVDVSKIEIDFGAIGTAGKK